MLILGSLEEKGRQERSAVSKGRGDTERMTAGVVDFTGTEKTSSTTQSGKHKKAQSAAKKKHQKNSSEARVHKRSKRMRGHCHRAPPKPPLLRELEKRGDAMVPSRGKRGGTKNTKRGQRAQSHNGTPDKSSTPQNATKDLRETELMRRAGVDAAQSNGFKALWRSMKASNLLVHPSEQTETLVYASVCVPACIFALLAGKPKRGHAHALIVVPSGDRAEKLAHILRTMLADCVWASIACFREGSGDVQAQVSHAASGVSIAVSTAKRLDALVRTGALTLPAAVPFAALDSPELDEDPKHLRRLRSRLSHGIKRVVVLLSCYENAEGHDGKDDLWHSWLGNEYKSIEA